MRRWRPRSAPLALALREGARPGGLLVEWLLRAGLISARSPMFLVLENDWKKIEILKN